MKVFLLEYFLSQSRDDNQSKNFYIEAKNILSSLFKSFMKISDLSLETIINNDFTRDFKNFDYENINILSPNFKNKAEYYSYLEKLDLHHFDYFLIIAPESSQILSKITKIMEDKNAKNLGSSSESIKKAANKWLLYKKFYKKDFKLPESKLISRNNLNQDFSFYPAVIKKIYGAGSDVKIVNNELELDKIDFDEHQNYIIQKIIKGISGSISAVSNSSQMQILSINKQIIDLDDFSYKGGIVNYNFPNQKKLKSLFLEVQKTYPGLNGYFGIDFIYADQKFYLLEVNPRITSSIIGLAELGNPAKIILDLIDKNIFNNNLKKEKLKFLI
ncbi:MAG: ATP-grasp domain-containing protein [Halanaerobium sp.]